MKTGLALLLIGALQSRQQTGAADLERSLAQAITNTVYSRPTAEQRELAKVLFGHTLRGDRTAAQLKSEWSALGLELTVVRAGEDPVWILREPTGTEAGRGWYLFRPGQRSTLALQTPHARNDVYTGVIGLRLFLEGPARAYAASTITRHRADMAHLNDTFFQAFALAFAEACPTGLIVQIHGFESTTPRGAADIIASAGTRSPKPWFPAFVARLKQTTRLRVLGYPQDTSQLGATKNAQGQALQNSHGCRFLHLEITREVRERLTRDAQLRQDLLESLESCRRRGDESISSTAPR